LSFGSPGLGYTEPVPDARTNTPGELVEEAARGRSERTPLIAIGGVTIVVGAIVVVLLAVAFLVYMLA
jgi:hypothetical protein